MSRYISKPQVIEAVQWTGDDPGLEIVREFASNRVAIIGQAPPAEPTRVRHHLRLQAGVDGAQGWVPVPVGHWIVRSAGDLTDYWPVDPDYFAAKYEPYTTVHAEDFLTETP